MNDPLGTGNFIEWSDHVKHRNSFSPDDTVEHVYESMLSQGIEFAAVTIDDDAPIGLISFKMLTAALSAKYGHALFAKKALKTAKVPSVVFGPLAKLQAEQQVPIIIPLEQAAVFNPVLDFFAAQAWLERRTPYHSFDDIIVTNEAGKYVGMIVMRDFMALQMNVLRWQETELRRSNVDMNRTLSQLSQAQAELVNSAKMAALGELVAGIAHEMNTPIGVLISSHDMIEKLFDLLNPDVTPERWMQLEHLLRTNIDLGREASERVSHIIHSLRIFGRNDQEEQHTANLVDLIASALVLLANKFKSSVTVHTDFVERGRVLCYPGQISQVLVNVLTNASQAMGGKGDIYIELERGKSYWELTIRDTGPGIPSQVMDRIFDPGFTTKGVGVGTGLGLSISKKIVVANHNGRISAYNHPKGGAIFLIELPLMLAETESELHLKGFASGFAPARN